MRQVVGVPSLTVRFSLESVGPLHENAPLFDFSTQYLSGAYVFTVDGFEVNADVDELSGEATWILEDLSMSLQLLENMTAWVEGKSKGAGCYYDYVSFSLLELDNDQVELLSYYEGSPETRRIAYCKKVELFLAFDEATHQWEAYYARLWQEIGSGNHKNAFRNLTPNVQRKLDPGIWIVALAQWHNAITAFKNSL